MGVTSEEERQNSLSNLSKGLSELGVQLETAQNSVLPWTEVTNTKQQVAEMQNTIAQQIDDAKKKEEDMDGQEEVVKSQSLRRRSLSEVSQTLSAINDKLTNAEASWTPWDEVNDAKQQIADMRNVVVRQIDEGKAPVYLGA